jgi:hypothetical protein
MELIYRNLNHFMFILLLISRLGDVVSTLLATPKLKLETNVIARKLGKPFIFLTLLIAVVAYYNVALAVAVLIPSLMVSASNMGKVWFLKKYGESNYYELICALVKKNGIKGFILFNILSSLFIVLIGFTIYVLVPSPEEWGFWIALGFFAYGFVIIFWGTINYLTLNRRIKKSAAHTPPTLQEGEKT